MFLSGLIQVVVFGSMLFLAAGTLRYWQAWVFLAIFVVSIWSPSIYLLRTNPEALQRRMRAGRRRNPGWRKRSPSGVRGCR
ncbi:putative membrane protein [Mycobacterium xenopi 3993]|nr:putative membrane protein [Mycobacterium xenopi 3993]